MTPDYENGLMDVYKGFVESCVERTKSLDIICHHWAPYALDPKKGNWVTKRGIASWMPAPSLTEYLHIGIRSTFAGDSKHSYCNASAGREAQASFGVKFQRLELFEQSLVTAIQEDRSCCGNRIPRVVSDGTVTVNGRRVDFIESIGNPGFNGAIGADTLELGGFVDYYGFLGGSSRSILS